MPNLRFVNLSENDLSKCNYSADSFDTAQHRLENIKSLVLNNTRIPWPAVQLLLNLMPSIEDLHLSLNNYASIELKRTSRYPNIKFLYLSGNPHLGNWKDVKLLLETFPSLEGLTMADCNIDSIPEEVIPFLVNIVSLNISNWPIKSWNCVDRLSKLPKLVKLRCQGIHVLNTLETCDMRRQHLIARLPQIQRLNGGDIINDERVFAERAFIRYFISDESKDKPSR